MHARRWIVFGLCLWGFGCGEDTSTGNLYIADDNTPNLNGGTPPIDDTDPVEDVVSVSDSNSPGVSPVEGVDVGQDQSDLGQADPVDSGTAPVPIDPEGSTRFVRIVTTQSPSWVAWNEIEVYGTWAGESGEIQNLALGATVTASSFGPEAPPDAATDGNMDTSWNAEDFPEAFIELNLGGPANISEVRLHVAQMPAGTTQHILLFANNTEIFESIHVFEKHSSAGDILIFPPADPPCSYCLDGHASCADLCVANGYTEGVCVSPDSIDSSNCCACSGSPNNGGDIPFTLDEVIWLHIDVSDWPVTTELDVSFQGGNICFDYDTQNTWPAEQIMHNSGDYMIDVVANPWVFIEHEGQWYAGTWEWFKPGPACKPKHTVAGDHIKQPPFKAMDWKPSPGQTLYFMVSGLARFSHISNISERSNIVELVWQ